MSQNHHRAAATINPTKKSSLFEVPLDQTNKIEAQQHLKQGCTRKAAKPVKAREEAQKPIDPERLNKAIQRLRNERQR